MDVDKFTFPSRLLDVLEAIAEAHFVSFDLELSGVPVKQSKDSAGKPTLQERYLETKHAAEQFQILQIGLTCVEDDASRQAYICRPFNFNLSPVIAERLDVDRTFSFHSGAVEFLLGVGFKMDLPFTTGVPYLSRDEARLAQERAAARNDRSSYADIEIKPEDVQALEFCRRVRSEIDTWVKTGKPGQHSIVIGPKENSGRDVELNRYERRLVHQIVRSEYPDLVSFPNKGLIRVSKLDREREEYFKAQRKKEVQDRITRQTGFRWIVEALCGNPPDDLDVKSFAQTPEGTLGLVDLGYLKSRFSRAKHMIRGKKTALFGHNLFLDLVYLYNTFIGSLPDTVEEFGTLINQLFPIIVDTKYMATHNCGDINPQSSLEQIAEQLSGQQRPRVVTHSDHGKYNGLTAFHEAGYDSMLTAEVAVRLSTKLELAGSHAQEDESDSVPPTPPDDGGGVQLSKLNPSTANGLSVVDSAIDGVRDLLLAPLKVLSGQGNSAEGKVTNPDKSGNSGHEKALERSTVESSKTLRGQDHQAGLTEEKPINKKKKNKSKNAVSVVSARQGGRFAHATAFDQLQDTALEDFEDDTGTEEEVLHFDALPSANAYASDPVVADTDGVSDPHWDTPVENEAFSAKASEAWGAREVGTYMPEFDSDFWTVYGNKLRIFGTQEGFAVLG